MLRHKSVENRRSTRPSFWQAPFVLTRARAHRSVRSSPRWRAAAPARSEAAGATMTGEPREARPVHRRSAAARRETTGSTSAEPAARPRSARAATWRRHAKWRRGGGSMGREVAGEPVADAEARAGPAQVSARAGRPAGRAVSARGARQSEPERGRAGGEAEMAAPEGQGGTPLRPTAPGASGPTALQLRARRRRNSIRPCARERGRHRLTGTVDPPDASVNWLRSVRSSAARFRSWARPLTRADSQQETLPKPAANTGMDDDAERMCPSNRSSLRSRPIGRFHRRAQLHLRPAQHRRQRPELHPLARRIEPRNGHARRPRGSPSPRSLPREPSRGRTPAAPASTSTLRPALRRAHVGRAVSCQQHAPGEPQSAARDRKRIRLRKHVVFVGSRGGGSPMAFVANFFQLSARAFALGECTSSLILFRRAGPLR